MPVQESTVERGKRIARSLHHDIGEQVRQARVGAGLSQREVGRLIGTSHQTVARIERGGSPVTLDRLAILATVLGLKLSTGLFPAGSPVRDAAHLALLGRLRSTIGSSLRIRIEVPMPSPGDLRSADGLILDPSVDAMVEAETHVDDVQVVLRRARAKQRDLGCRRLILLLSDSRHHRELLRSHPELRDEFPIPMRLGLGRLRRGLDPGGDMIVLL